MPCELQESHEPDTVERTDRPADTTEEAQALVERGAILHEAAGLDDLLGRMLRARLIRLSQNHNILRQGGPLGTFTIRVELTRMLGWISADQWYALHQVNSIRKCAAHRIEGASLRSPGQGLHLRQLLASVAGANGRGLTEDLRGFHCACERLRERLREQLGELVTGTGHPGQVA